jgi:hypothetical protein
MFFFLDKKEPKSQEPNMLPCARASRTPAFGSGRRASFGWGIVGSRWFLVGLGWRATFGCGID